MGLANQRALVAGIEVRPVAGQHGGIVNGRLAEPIVIVVAEEVIGGAELVIDSGDVLVEVVDRGLYVTDRASDLPGRFRAGERRKLLFEGHGRWVEGAGRDPVERIRHVGEWIGNLLAGGLADAA